MKHKILLATALLATCATAVAQKKSQKVTAYAITGTQKGAHNWTEVNLVDVSTGEVISPVYQSKSEIKRLNARSGKPIKISEPETTSFTTTTNTNGTDRIIIDKMVPVERMKENLVATRVEGVRLPATVNGQQPTTVTVNVEPTINVEPRVLINTQPTVRVSGNTRVFIRRTAYRKDQPFATASAACAFDKKHNRLYYTPMGINQLRYIDMDSKTPSVNYFEDEAFGTVSGNGDVQNQITRMTFASDGKGYALTNDAQQLIQFTTKKNAVITNLGAVTDDVNNGKFSVHNTAAYGGDMVADESGNLYLVTANRRVYRISLETRVATYLGSIKGLPEGFTTNGAVVESGDAIIVTSSNSTDGYYRFSLDGLNAEKVSSSNQVFNASDLANGNLLSIKKKREKEVKPETVKTEPEAEVLANESKIQKEVDRSLQPQVADRESALAIYPNPVTNGSTRLSMTNYPEGRYDVQLMDLSGKQLTRQIVQLNSKVQVSDLRLPNNIAKGTYLVRITNEAGQIMNTEKIVVQ